MLLAAAPNGVLNAYCWTAFAVQIWVPPILTEVSV
jgi:hypothetical protein